MQYSLRWCIVAYTIPVDATSLLYSVFGQKQCSSCSSQFGKWHRQNVFEKVFKYTEL